MTPGQAARAAWMACPQGDDPDAPWEAAAQAAIDAVMPDVAAIESENVQLQDMLAAQPQPAPGGVPGVYVRWCQLDGFDPPAGDIAAMFAGKTSAERYFWESLDECARTAAQPCPGCESLRRQHAETCGEVGMLAGALHEIQGAHDAGTHAHDTAHAALDRLHGLPPAQPQPAPGDARLTDDVTAPAVARPPFGSVLVLAVTPGESDATVRAAEEALAAAQEGVTVVTVRGVEALRIWEPAAPQPTADVRPREGEPGWHDVTCGACGEEFGTNFKVEEIECPECEARRCPHCGTWFGGFGGDDSE